MRTCGGAQSKTCVDVDRAEAGLHLAEITIIDKSNQSLSYQWAFRMEKDMYNNYVTPMYLPPTPPRH